jgi:hypothetical protein
MLLRTSFFTVVLLAAPVLAGAQSMVNLTHQPPDGSLAGLLLTDGTVLVQGNGYTDWWRLTPDINGSYKAGTWSQVASLPSGYAPLYFASAVLADGRVIIAGGEYNNGVFAFTDQCAIFDPVADTWTTVTPPSGWDYIGDSPAVVLPNGQFLVGRKFDTRMAALDPATLTWTEMSSAGKRDFNAEEGWTLLPTGNVFTYDVKKAPHAETYAPSAQAWASAGKTPVLLKGPPYVKVVKYGNGQVYHPPGEVGPGLLMPNGTVFATGATPKGGASGNTAVFDPVKQTWTAGPSFPSGIDAGDSASALLPTGNALVRGSNNQFFEFNGTALTATNFAGTTYGTLFVLPTGQVLVSGAALYQASGTVNQAWAPVITTAPTAVTRGSTYAISGQQFNGVSQAASFGDEVQSATNYPLVRLTNNATGHVFYARTHDHSTMGVATGTATVSTNFDVPAAAEKGASTLEVVANGIASAGVAVTIR